MVELGTSQIVEPYYARERCFFDERREMFDRGRDLDDNGRSSFEY